MLVRFKRVIYFISSLRPNKTQVGGGGYGEHNEGRNGDIKGGRGETGKTWGHKTGHGDIGGLR